MNGESTSTSAPATRFDHAFARLIRLEGGYVNNPADAGGATKYGISLRFLRAEGRIDLNRDGRDDFDLDMDGDIDAADIRLLTPALAKTLYKRCFWDRLGCDTIPTPIGEAMFDQAVNGGLVAAVRLLQRALNRVISNEQLRSISLAEDGQFGPRTRAMLDVLMRRVGADPVLRAYRRAANDRYLAIVADDPSQAVFLDGWLTRAAKLGSL